MMMNMMIKRCHCQKNFLLKNSRRPAFLWKKKISGHHFRQKKNSQLSASRIKKKTCIQSKTVMNKLIKIKKFFFNIIFGFYVYFWVRVFNFGIVHIQFYFEETNCQKTSNHNVEKKRLCVDDIQTIKNSLLMKILLLNLLILKSAELRVKINAHLILYVTIVQGRLKLKL